MSGTVRVFVAVELEPQVREAIGREIARLAASNADVKWVEPGNLHLTLKFLGNVDRRKVPEILKALEGAARGTSPFPVRWRGLGLFPNRLRPKVVSAGLEDGEGAEALRALAERVEEALSEIGFGRESRRFRTHVTLGRVKSPKGLKKLDEELLLAAGEAFGEQEVGAVTLFMSELSREGPRYTVLGRAALRSPGATDGSAAVG